MAGEGNGTARWQLYLSAGSLALFVVGSLIGLLIQIASLTYATADTRAKMEAMESRLGRVEQQSQLNQTSITVMRSDMGEIDTQLRASIDDRNLGHAWDLRIESVLWEQAFKGRSHLPIGNAVYPNIADGKSR